MSNPNLDFVGTAFPDVKMQLMSSCKSFQGLKRNISDFRSFFTSPHRAIVMLICSCHPPAKRFEIT
jgi:hypothetical protein